MRMLYSSLFNFEHSKSCFRRLTWLNSRSTRSIKLLMYPKKDIAKSHWHLERSFRSAEAQVEEDAVEALTHAPILPLYNSQTPMTRTVEVSTSVKEPNALSEIYSSDLTRRSFVKRAWKILPIKMDLDKRVARPGLVVENTTKPAAEDRSEH
ncbi:hypothetical protein KCU98_g21526, partial [Aureobasidium melanogenum]